MIIHSFQKHFKCDTVDFQKTLDEKLVDYGLTSAQFCVLAKLLEEEGVSQTELASRLFIENPTLVRTLDKMEAIGLIERRKNPGDRRAYLIYLLRKGRALDDVVQEIGLKVHREATKGLTKKDVSKLREYLAVIRKNFERRIR